MHSEPPPFPVEEIRGIVRAVFVFGRALEAWAMAPPPPGEAIAEGSTFVIENFKPIASTEEGAKTMAAGQGVVGNVAHGVLNLEDDRPDTTGAKAPESVEFESEDETVATVGPDPDAPDDQLRLLVTLVGVGSTRILAHVDPGEGTPWDKETTVEARAPEPGEAVAEGSTFELGAFETIAT